LATNLIVRRSESENLEWLGITAESMHWPLQRTVLHVHTANGDWLRCPQPTPPRPPKHPLQWTVLPVPVPHPSRTPLRSSRQDLIGAWTALPVRVFPRHADGASGIFHVTLLWGLMLQCRVAWIQFRLAGGTGVRFRELASFFIFCN
jgi:hypothetical protein